MTTLVHQGLVLRPFDAADAEAFAEAARESVRTVGRWMSWCHGGYTAGQAQAWFDMCALSLAEASGHEFGIFREGDGEFLGGAGLNHVNFDHNFCNLGYWVRETAHGQGVATRAAQALIGHAFDTLGFTRIEIVTAQGNLPSAAVALKLGATFECVARNRLVVHGQAVDARVHSLVPTDRRTATNP